MNPNGCPRRSAIAASWVSAALAGCVVSPTHDAPIVERSQTQVAEAASASSATTAEPAAPPIPVREAHGGVYVVQAGDTLYSIALAFGQDFRDIARWNGLDDPTRLHSGQSLRVAAPAPEDSGAGAAEATPVPVATSGSIESHALAPTALGTPSPPGGNAATGDAGRAADTPRNADAAPAAGSDRAAVIEPEGAWAWPSAGKILERFDATHNKGIEIAGSVGDPVLAANDGQVVYSGNALSDYANLVIIKHTDDYVSVYAHNNEILVTKGQAVKRGQRIAELGMTDAPNPRLHFEIRRRGKPVDPLTYLPSR